MEPEIKVEEVVLTQQDIDENPILEEAGLQAGDVGEVVSEEELKGEPIFVEMTAGLHGKSTLN